jgi:hypothetical protein
VGALAQAFLRAARAFQLQRRILKLIRGFAALGRLFQP